MSEMIERVADALYRLQVAQGIYLHSSADAARIAIEAMREPTNDMVNHAADMSDRLYRDDCRYAWREMCDAALK